MDYEKAYKESFNVAKCLHEAGDIITRKQIERLFPQLVESDDEWNWRKVRRAIRGFFTNPIDANELLAWLEKQKEPKNTSASTMVPSCWEVEQKEHDHAKKPSMLELLREHLANTPKEQLDAEFEALKEFTIPKPAEWSEEDENMAYFVNQFLEYHELSDPTAKSCKKWFNNRFKSLRPQPKRDGGDDYNKAYIKGRTDTLKEFNDMASWKPSKEEIDAFENLLKGEFPNKIFPGATLANLLNTLKKLYYNEAIPSTWKPSEEQMKALEHFIRSWGESGTMGPQNTILCAANSLLTDLQKLL